MRSRQKGITFIGWIFLLAPLVMVVFAAIKVTPLYLNYMKVAKAMSQVAEENAGESAVTQQTLRVALQGRFDIEDVDYPTPRDITMTREGGEGGWVMQIEYDDTATLFSGISLQVHFDKSVVVK
jgi:hypothetical protein